jgi:hypothetical protein
MSTTVISCVVGTNEPTTAEDIPNVPEMLSMPGIENLKSLKKGFIAFYGFRDANQAMTAIRRHYFKTPQNVHRIALRIATENESGDSRGTLANLATHETLSLWRCDKALMHKICIILGVTDPEYAITNDISLLDTLWQNKEFKHVKVFIWKGDYNITSKIAAIRDRDFVETMDVT